MTKAAETTRSGPYDERPRVTIFDTTLRDGEQSPGCSMHTGREGAHGAAARAARRRHHRGRLPDRLAGDFEAVQAIAEAFKGARVAALCRAKAMDIEAAGKALEPALHPVIHTFLATSDIHLQYKLRITPEEVLKQAVEGVEARPHVLRRGRVLGRGRLAQRLRLPAARCCRRSTRPARRRSTCPTPSATRCPTSTRS